MANDDQNKKTDKKEYNFGGIQEFNLEEIEAEILNDSVYLDVFAGSDEAFKTDVDPLENPLSLLNNLHGMTYHYKTKEFPKQNFPTDKQIGLMAQDVEKIYPLAVTTDEEGLKYVNYASLAPILIESIKELHQIVNEQKAEIERLKRSLN
jgi:hypothetical protein